MTTKLVTRGCKLSQLHSCLSFNHLAFVNFCSFRDERDQCCGHGQDAQLQDGSTESALAMYVFFYYSDENNIGIVGTKLLIKAEMPLLERLWLGNYL